MEDLLQFVLRHYRRGLWDPDKAIVRFRKNIGYYDAWKARRAVWRLSAAAVAALLLAAGLALHRSSLNRWEETTASSVMLPDHSTVRLKDGSTLAFQPRRFSKERTVRLEGTAYFEVVSDPGAPFEVRSGEARVRVLGTKFQFDAEHREVFLSEGRLLFAREDSDKGLLMTDGTAAVLEGDAAVPVFITTASLNPLAWATGRLAYDAVPLAQVLDELSAIFGKELKTSSQSSDTVLLTAEFLVSDGLGHILSAIESALNVEILPNE
ncbi:MAG: FecR domain-containing protein [Bacteroidales bacterium]|nr:FecR domain-containing protein [Bacteroidales bacterium]